MKLPDFTHEHEPKFSIHDEVWVIEGKEVVKDRILSLLLLLATPGFEAPPILRCFGYRVNTANLDSNDLSFREDEIYATEALATEHAKWHAVENLSDAEWKLAIGDREDDDSLDNCELSRCCSTISNIRDILFRCQNQKGLIERDVRQLSRLISEHDYPTPHGERPEHLDKIMEKLGLLDSIKV